MMKFLKGVVIGGFAVFTFWLILWAGQLGRPHPNNEWIVESIAYKQRIAHTTPSPKVVILAGSGALFGINSARLEESYGLPTVNLGVNAGISLPAILHSAKDIIQPGDLVLLPLEYPLYNRDEVVSSALIHWANSSPETFLQLPLKRALEVFAKTSLSRILEGYRGIPQDFVVGGDYGVHNLDERGDQRYTHRELREERHWQFLNSLPAETYGHAIREGRYDWPQLRLFRDELLTLGACPIFIPPPLLFQRSYAESFIEAHFYETLPSKATAAGLLWLGRPEEAMRDADDFFDTNFHLVDEARTDYTQKIIGWLGNQPIRRCKQFYQALP